MTLVDWQIQHHCGDRSYKPQWWNLKAFAHKWLIPCPKRPMICPYNPEQVNAASYDVCIGGKAKLLSCEHIRYKLIEQKAYNDQGIEFYEKCLVPVYEYGNQDWQDIDLIELAEQKKHLYITQGDLLLAAPDDIFHIPRNMSAQFSLKSSRGREGYGHALAGFIDPAWHNSKLTLELFNHNPNPIPIYKGLRIGQIIFTRCDAQPIKAYDERGRYNGDDGVRESKG